MNNKEIILEWKITYTISHAYFLFYKDSLASP